ncbi:unnamed protein product [Mytilus edulis]|uniref:Uncharacterized protein n=1 Tax=Mytilus edulis TaxID=6550 RepID=A0A8S3SD93_MYTED|nr:unnamed protein product [Mytilus edulis]
MFKETKQIPESMLELAQRENIREYINKKLEIEAILCYWYSDSDEGYIKLFTLKAKGSKKLWLWKKMKPYCYKGVASDVQRSSESLKDSSFIEQKWSCHVDNPVGVIQEYSKSIPKPENQFCSSVFTDVNTSFISHQQLAQWVEFSFYICRRYAIYIPKIYQYFRKLVGLMVQDGSVPLSFLKESCQPLKGSGKAGILVANILHDASDREVS